MGCVSYANRLSHFGPTTFHKSFLCLVATAVAMVDLEKAFPSVPRRQTNHPNIRACCLHTNRKGLSLIGSKYFSSVFPKLYILWMQWNFKPPITGWFETLQYLQGVEGRNWPLGRCLHPHFLLLQLLAMLFLPSKGSLSPWYLLCFANSTTSNQLGFLTPGTEGQRESSGPRGRWLCCFLPWIPIPKPTLCMCLEHMQWPPLCSCLRKEATLVSAG